MINLCLVVIATQFSETKKRETERMLAERRRFSRSSSTLLSDEPGSCWEETIKYLERLWKHAYRRLSVRWHNYRAKHSKVRKSNYSIFELFFVLKNKMKNVEMKKHRRKQIAINNVNPREHHLNSISFANLTHRPNCRFYQKRDSSSVFNPSLMCPSYADAPAASPEQSEIVDSTHTPSANVEPDAIRKSSSINNDFDNSSIPSIALNNMPQKQCQCFQFNDRIELADDDIEDDSDNDDNEEQKPPKQKSKFAICCDRYCFSRYRLFRSYISKFVGSKYFRRIVLTAIVVNTLSMGIEYHGQKKSLEIALEYSNIVFTTLFAIEMILKLIADGCLKYIRNAYNLFDGGIVLMSVIELQGNKNSGLSVLRTFRLLRVLKLVRFMPTLRRQLVGKRCFSVVESLVLNFN